MKLQNVVLTSITYYRQCTYESNTEYVCVYANTNISRSLGFNRIIRVFSLKAVVLICCTESEQRRGIIVKDDNEAIPGAVCDSDITLTPQQ